MNTRHISLIAIIQVFALACALFASSITTRFGQIANEALNGKPLPVVFAQAQFFKDYGIWCSIFIIIWTGFALHSFKSSSTRYTLITSIAGIGFVLLMFFLGLIFFVGSFFPFRSI